MEHGMKAEKLTAKRIGGNLVPGSGSGYLNKGDIRLGEYLLENKATMRGSLSIKLDWLRQIAQQAMEKTQIPALFFQFVDNAGNPLRNGRWVAIPEDEFLRIMDKGDLE